jgi:hypothetical protein
MPRFNRRGKTGVWFVPSLAAPGNPSAAAIAAGTPLHDIIRSMTGWTSEQEDLDNSDLSSTWNGTLPGGETPAASSFTFAAGNVAGDVEETARTTIVEGANGYIVMTKWKKTPTSTEKADVFPVRVKAVNDEYTVDNAVAQWVAGFSIYDPPNKNVTIAT